MNINRELSQIPEGIAFSFSPPAIPGVGTSGGFTFVLEDRAGNDVEFLANNLNTFLAAARKRPKSPASTPRFSQACRNNSSTWIATRSSNRASP